MPCLDRGKRSFAVFKATWSSLPEKFVASFVWEAYQKKSSGFMSYKHDLQLWKDFVIVKSVVKTRQRIFPTFVEILF